MARISLSSGKGRARARLARLSRPLLLVLGSLFLTVGIAGIFLPLVPGTLFLILAAACFARSSPRFEGWLLGHPRLGPPIRRWRETGAIPRTAKALAIGSLGLSWIILLTTGRSSAVLLSCLAVFVAVALYIGTRPEA